MPALPNLRRLREAKFLTQQELAEKAEIHKVTIARLEGGKAQAEFRTTRKLAEALGVAPEELL